MPPLYIVLDLDTDATTKTDKESAYKLAWKMKEAGGNAIVYEEDYYRQYIHFKK